MTPQEFETYRLENKFSHGLMAEKIGIVFSSYYKFVKKNSKPHLSTWKKLEKFYNENIEKKEISIKDYFESTPIKYIEPKTQSVYLVSVEEIITELLCGNEIHIESSTGHTLKMVDGFVVRYSNGEAVSINSPILCSERYYVIKPIPVNLEVGERYISRDGRVATVFNKHENVFYGVFDNDAFIRSYTSNGECVNSSKDDDLIEEK